MADGKPRSMNGGGGVGTRPPPQPKEPSPPARPPAEGGSVTPGYVTTKAVATLPDATAYAQYLTWARTELAPLRQQILDKAGFNSTAFTARMIELRGKLRDAETALNTKRPAPIPTMPSKPQLPGAGGIEECRSVFDASDLVLSGIRSVKTKRFHVPIVFPDMTLSGDQRWKFGQKLEYRQEWRHHGFTLGDLISSLSLLPNEELTLEVSSWQRAKSEIQSEQEETARKQLEQEERRSDEETTVREAASSQGWSLSATGSISYGPVSASVSRAATSSTENRASATTQHMAEATTKAANEVSLRRAIKITETSESGSELRNTRRITNPNTCRTVTYNFFQVVRLYDVQLRLDNDAPVLMLPSIFPETYSGDDSVVRIPYSEIEAFNSPANFLTQYFEADRDLSEEVHGWGLRVPCNVLATPETAIAQVADAMLVATRFLLGIDPKTCLDAIASLVGSYMKSAEALRTQQVATYGPNLGRREQVATAGTYVDSMLGRCTACEDYVESTRYLDAWRQNHENSRVAAEANRLQQESALLAQEVARRQKRLAAGDLEPFDTAGEG